jgi:dTDP-4-dehydrorhamnose 3,5-epimerase
VKVVVYDDRPGSATAGDLLEVFLGPDDYSLVSIGPGIWSGFKGMSEPYAIVANCCTHPHDPSRTTRVDPFDNDIPYDWTVHQH